MKKILMLTLLFTSLAFSANLQLQSNENRTMLIELYTSQGCSSCPIADDWLNELKEHPKLFETFIPLAFHITYWDFLGWKDIFANVLNDNRQRNYATRVWQNNSVYTPQFVVNANEYRKWFSYQGFPQVPNQYGGILKADITDNNFEVNFQTKAIKTKEVYLNIAVLGFDYNIDIARGENEDRRLHHDFVVLNHHQKFANIVKGKLAFKGLLPKVKEDTHDKAIAIWVSDKSSNIIQVVGGYLNY